MRRSVEILYSIWRGIVDWLEMLLQIGRVIIPPIMLCLLIGQARDVYIPYIGIEITAMMMRCVIIASHSVSMWYGMRSKCSRGVIYEICCCLLATEIVLFIYFMQYQLTISIVLLTIIVIYILYLLTYGRNQLERFYLRGFIPQDLLDDDIATSKNNQKLHSLLSTALRRRLAIGIALVFLIPSIAVVTVYGTDGVLHQGNEHAVIDNSQENQLLLNLPTLQKLYENQWDLLTEQEKIDVLQTVADIETAHMGIQPITVANRYLKNRTLGAYDHSQRNVQIDLSKHDGYEPIEYVNTILHECRHAYQHDCVDSLDWSDPAIENGIYYEQARKWRYEHANYTSMAEDRDAYYEQTIEIDARQYAENGAYIYQQYINFANLPAR